MLTIFSNEVDIEMSEQNSDDCTEYKFRARDDYDDDDDCMFSSSKGLSATTKKSNTLILNSQSYSYYDRKNLNSPVNECKAKYNEIDHFDANELRGLHKDIDYTGDKVDSDESNKSNMVSQYAFEQALKLNQLRQEIVCSSKSDHKHGNLYNKTFPRSNNSSTISKKPEFVQPVKKYLPHAAGKTHKSNCKVSSAKDMSDMESITLLIRVPRNKLMNHIKNKAIVDQWKSIPKIIIFISDSKLNPAIYTSSSCDSIESSSTDKDSDTLRENCESSEILHQKMKPCSISESDITSIIDKSKEIIQNCKESMKKSNKKLQTFIPNSSELKHQSDKRTQTFHIPQDSLTNSTNNQNNYFLCNICHKIVPANLSPICLKLSCSAIKKCNHIFHGELDMIMHLPVKHTNEFASYHICSKCNRMYHPSNIVTIKGGYTCLDCVSSLVQLNINE